MNEEALRRKVESEMGNIDAERRKLKNQEIEIRKKEKEQSHPLKFNKWWINDIGILI